MGMLQKVAGGAMKGVGEALVGHGKNLREEKRARLREEAATGRTQMGITSREKTAGAALTEQTRASREREKLAQQKQKDTAEFRMWQKQQAGSLTPEEKTKMRATAFEKAKKLESDETDWGVLLGMTSGGVGVFDTPEDVLSSTAPPAIKRTILQRDFADYVEKKRKAASGGQSGKTPVAPVRR